MGVELSCSGIVISSCSTSGTRRLTLVTNPLRSNECGKDWITIMTNGTYLWSIVTVNQVMVETVKLSK